MIIPDITQNKLEKWDQFKDKTPNEIIKCVYEHISNTSHKICSWYWSSISKKRNTSLAVRFLALSFLMVGTVLPLIAAVAKAPEHRLDLTQVGIAVLILAGLLQLADRIFGWSSGWMRYISTVTAMENLTRTFQMEWGQYLITTTLPLELTDAQTLFTLALKLEQELTQLQAEETNKWVTEFTSGIALLDSMIKTQREQTEKKLDEIRASLTEKERKDLLDKKEKLHGSLEVTLVFKGDAKSIMIGIVPNDLVEFLGNSWTQIKVSPGQHILRIRTMSEPNRIIERVVDIKPDEINQLEVSIGE
jgi:uncharacterized protein YgfB (UPF0149 family)